MTGTGSEYGSFDGAEALADAAADAFDHWEELGAGPRRAVAPTVEAGLDALDRGELRAALRVGDEWVADGRVKKLILLSFRLAESHGGRSGPGRPVSYDKIPLKFEGWDDVAFAQSQLRVVPGAVVRRGAHIGSGAVLMPSFVNVGAWVGAETMVDTWATIGSCAQVGRRCHISGGAGIGGVLEPIGQSPVVIEDEVFVGARCEVAEGVVVRTGAVLAMGVHLGRSTPIVDRATGAVVYGEVPAGAVVVPGARAVPGRNLSVSCAVVVKYADDGTRGRTALDDVFREQS